MLTDWNDLILFNDRFQIAIPKQSNVSCISWNHSSGYIAVGGEEGMLKVLKLESGNI